MFWICTSKTSVKHIPSNEEAKEKVASVVEAQWQGCARESKPGYIKKFLDSIMVMYSHQFVIVKQSN
jgi:hypothetical protein